MTVKQVLLALLRTRAARPQNWREQKMINYVYRVVWSVEDKEFVGLCAEFPSLSYLDEDHLKAIEGITTLVKDIVADMEANGEPAPIPECR